MKLNRFDITFWVGVIIWLTETWAFGWNATPQSATESALDLISGSLIIYGALGMIVIAL